MANLLTELRLLLERRDLDVEFAVDGDGELYLLQLRPLTPLRYSTIPPEMVNQAARDISRKVELLSRPHPYLHGNDRCLG